MNYLNCLVRSGHMASKKDSSTPAETSRTSEKPKKISSSSLWGHGNLARSSKGTGKQREG